MKCKWAPRSLARNSLINVQRSSQRCFEWQLTKDRESAVPTMRRPVYQSFFTLYYRADCLVDLFARARSFGACCVLPFQRHWNALSAWAVAHKDGKRSFNAWAEWQVRFFFFRPIQHKRQMRQNVIRADPLLFCLIFFFVLDGEIFLLKLVKRVV